MFYDKTVLNNGITVITESMEAVRSVALGLWMRVGNRDETPEIAGMSHFMEHMLFKGTPTRSALDISSAFDALGAELNAFTSREYTCYYTRMIDEHLADGFEILADMLVNASFTQETIDPERKVVIEEIARSEDTPDDHIYDVFAGTIYPNDVLGRPVLGTRDIVGGFTTADMRAYHDARYTTGNLTVVACGSVDHEQVVQLAERYLSDMLVGERLAAREPVSLERDMLSVVTKDTEQAHLILGMPSVPAGDERVFALSLLDIAMGGGMSSRLFNEIREKRGLVYSVYASTHFFEGAGCFGMYAGTRPDNVEEVISVARAEFDKAADEGITQEELDRARELTCGSFVLSQESTRNHMTRLGRRTTVGLPLYSIDEVIEKYRAITLEQVNNAAQELFTKQPTLAVISPYKQEEIEGMLV